MCLGNHTPAVPQCPLCEGRGELVVPVLQGGGWTTEPCPKCHPHQPEPRWLRPVLLTALALISIGIVLVLACSVIP